MALDPKSKKDVDEARLFIQDTLLSVGAKISESIKDSIEQAVDGVDASVIDKLGKDITRSFSSLAKFSDDTANNTYRIDQGLLKSKDVTKQLLSLQEKMAQLNRKKELANLNQIKFNEEDFDAAKKSLQTQQQLLQNDLQETKDIEKKLGLVGKFASALGQIPGIGQFLRVDEIEVEMRKAAASGAGKFKTMGIAASMVGKQLAEGLTDPAFILGKIFTTYLDINKASVELSHLTGQNAVKFENIGVNAASLKDTLETINALTKQTGMNAQNIFSSKVIGQAAALKTTMGLTADEAGGLATISQTTGKEVDGVVKSVVATTSAFNGANRAAVSQGVVLREVANTSDSIKLSLGNNPEALAKAAAAATRLGLSLKDVDNIAASLTDFQSSISNELEAELLTGKDLNLEKARELALNNDLEGVSKELFKNSSDIAEFGKMNRIQQESYAKALGMTKDQLAKMAYNKALEAGMTEDQAAAAANVNAEDMKRVAMQENFAKAIEKISGALAPILDIVGDILSMPLAPYILIAGLAAVKLGGSLSGVGEGFGKMYKAGKEAFTGLTDLFKKGGLTSAIDKIKQGFGAGKAGGATVQATEAAKKIPEKSGGGMSSLTDSIQKIDPMKLLAGAAALVLVAASVFVFAKAAQEFAKVSWEDMAKAGVGLLGLVGALAAVGAIMMSGIGSVAILAGAAAIVIMAGGLFILGKALQEVGQGMQMMEPALALVSSIGDKAAGLATIGASLLGIAGGLKEIAAAGTGAIPVLEKLNSLGGSTSAGEAKSKSEEGPMAAVEKKLDTLIAAVKAGGNVYMDSNKVGRAQVLGSYKSA